VRKSGCAGAIPRDVPSEPDDRIETQDRFQRWNPSWIQPQVARLALFLCASPRRLRRRGVFAAKIPVADGRIEANFTQSRTIRSHQNANLLSEKEINAATKDIARLTFLGGRNIVEISAKKRLRNDGSERV
jgi:hypothetical protein